MNKIKQIVDQALKKSDQDTFSIAQMTSNSDGKTSGSGTMGVLTMCVGLISFIVGVVHFIVASDSTIMIQSIAILGIGTGLLGYRKSRDSRIRETRDLVENNHDHEHIKHRPNIQQMPNMPDEDMSGGDEDMSGGDEQLNS